jgi:hypothetical protein
MDKTHKPLYLLAGCTALVMCIQAGEAQTCSSSQAGSGASCSVTLPHPYFRAEHVAQQAPIESAPIPSPQTSHFKSMREAVDTLLTRESAHQWQKIEWRTDAATALRDARAENKPIFVFFVVKQQAASPKSWVGPDNDLGKT